MVAPLAVLVLFFAKMLTKILAVLPAVRVHKYERAAGSYYTLMMSPGLTFGTISALSGLNHKIITQAQYSYVVGTVIASAVVPTIIANTFFLPASASEKRPRLRNCEADTAACRARGSLG